MASRCRHILWLVLLSGLAACTNAPASGGYHDYEADLAILDLAPDPLLDIPSINDLLPSPDLPDSTVPPPDHITVDLSHQPTPIPTLRECRTTLTVTPPGGGPVAVAADFTDWADNEIPMSPDGNGSYTLDLDLSLIPPGHHGYKFHTAQDQWLLDVNNPLAIWIDGVENSKLIVPDCTRPELHLEDYQIGADGTTLTLTVAVADGAKSTGIIPSSAQVTVNRVALPDPGYDPATGTFKVTLDNLTPGTKVTLSVVVANSQGPSAPLIFPVWLDAVPWQWQDAAIYFAFTDRFDNGNPANDDPSQCTASDSLTNWQGGDFAGITARIESGYFDILGINVIWLSPVIDNPNGCMSGTLDGVTYTAYHGYFPLDLTATEDHFGTMQDLIALVDTAHAHGIRVLIDLVANHLYEDNPLYAQHQTDGWFHDFYPCEPNWDKPIECWFMPYLPDLDYTNDAVISLATENALFWVLETGIDGFRVDALKHMVHNFIRTLRHQVEDRIVTQAAPFYMVGETFMGEWGGGTGMAETVIKEYVNTWELNGQFDFPFYWKLVKATARDEGDFVEFADFLQAALPFWGEDAIMVSFLGNHDVPRFLSHAAGQIGDLWGNGSKIQGLTEPPELPQDAQPFARLRLAQGLLFTLPEVPMIYYGDEVGLPGAGDPDNRRNMPFEDLSSNQQETLAFVRQVATLRKVHKALRRGTLDILSATPETLVFRRQSGQEEVVVAANRASTIRTVEIPLPLQGDTRTELISDQTVTFSGKPALIELPPFALTIYQ
jgi:glycosidase